ncbi:aspartate/glutamate racemase family protein [Kineococcus sp. R86509]|uniref:aspartate/glutamate racemase family protein n=1 Tax=Kineococcus sp. R86509 TaxID=3093851 RepID=UPI0036D3B47A
MRLLLTNCNTTATMTDVMLEQARAAAAPGTIVTGLTPAWGPASCEGWMDSFISATAVLDAVLAYQGDGNTFDALIMAGFGEHGRQAAREVLEVPVVDITEAAAQLALLIGEKYAIVTSLTRTIPLIEDSLRSSGIFERCSTVEAVDLPVLDLERDEDATVAAFMTPARRALDGGADVLILGCAGMSYLQTRLSAELGVPVVDGVAAAVVLAEGLARLGLATSSRNSYAAPLPKARPGWPVGSALGRRPIVHTPTSPHHG